MSNYPYAKSPAKLEDFLQNIKRLGVPEKASSAWLKSSGYTSSNDSSMLGVLQFIGFLDSSRIPTEAWQDFRDENKSRAILGLRIRDGYSELFDHYPDAEKCETDELENFFRSKSNLGEKATGLMAKTFHALCSQAGLADASGDGAGKGDNGNVASASSEARLVVPPPTVDSPTPSLHIDFQVHIAADAPPEQIDKIFESMAKHLYGKDAD